MEIFMYVLLGLASLFAVLLLIAAIMPKQYEVAVSRVYPFPRNVVFEHVRKLENQLSDSEWLNSDAGVQYSIEGKDGESGATLKWKSTTLDKKRSVGSGEQEIDQISDSAMEVTLRLVEPMPATCTLRHLFETTEDGQTRYTCVFFACAKFPINLPAILIGKGMIRKKQEKTLENVQLAIASRV